MKRIALATGCLGAAVGAGYLKYPAEFERYGQAAAKTALRAWGNVEANPAPAGLALGTFLATVAYHKAKGKSLRESVEVAATRVTVVPVPADAGADESPVLRRAKARAARAQLMADQVGLQTRHRKYPEAVTKAEKDACYTEQAVTDAARVLAERKQAHDEAVARLNAVRKERAECEA